MMDKINLLPVSEWKSFLLADYFDMKGGKYHPKEMGEIDLLTPLVSASERDNGITSYVSGKPMFAGNALTIGKVGCVVNYQASPFSCTGDVVALMPKPSTPFNMAIGLFLKSIIQSESPKWSYGRQIRLNNCQRLVVKLPSSEDGNPNWQLMETYMKSLDANVAKVDKAPVSSKKVTLPLVSEWSAIAMKDIFTITNCKSFDKRDINISKDGAGTLVRYITRKGVNNGMLFHATVSDHFEKGGCITIGIEGCVAFYQEGSFIAGQNIASLRSEHLNAYNAQMFCKLLNHTMKGMFCYGRGVTLGRLMDLKVSVPVTITGDPDWQIMEAYVKSLPFSRSM
ncbi:restriction endonuclease subunit S [Vibrio astriarenae]